MENAIQIIEKVCEEVCNDLCKYAITTDESCECDYIKMKGYCPLEKLR